MITALIILVGWLTPIFTIGFIIYSDMDKGQSIEEYFDDKAVDIEDIFIPACIPVVNIFFAIYIIFNFIFDGLKHFRK